ncbi:MAG: histidine ammonia-lyase [Candidatus Thermoplasmatota archaeon]|nr:histidine ammonia-lyase [Candidatus Thermoplasmatota archaeon]
MTEGLRPRFGHSADPNLTVHISPGGRLTISELVGVARGDGKGHFARVELAGDWRDRCERSRKYVDDALRDALAKKAQTGKVDPRDLIYGVLTGFGHFKSSPLKDADEVRRMQENIVRSHSVGVGSPLPTEVVRGMMLLRVRAFVEGRSAVRPEIVELLVQMLNSHVHPWIPEQGSVGASGDLAPLAHLALVLIGEGFAWHDDSPELTPTAPKHGSSGWDPRLEMRPRPDSGRVALEKAGLRPIAALEAKEGLALTNGTALSASLGALAVYDADNLWGVANLSASLTLQAMMGFTRAFDGKVQQVRRHAGQIAAAAQMHAFLKHSKLVNKETSSPQDAYSLRCAPQVHGATGTAIDHVWEVLEEEINAVTDNPLFFVGDPLDYPEDPKVCHFDAYSGGNFHGQPISVVVDYLKTALAGLGGISERRIQMLLDSNHNRGLPGDLAPVDGGLNSGFMITQYTAAALVSENKVLAHPSSVDSIPTSSNAEDYVSMAPIGARHARRVVTNVTNILAIELMVALQALELRLAQLHHPGPNAPPARPTKEELQDLSPSARAVRELVRSGEATHALPAIPLLSEDAFLWPHIASSANLVTSGKVLRTALLATRT